MARDDLGWAERMMVSSIAHGGKGSGCCGWCDPLLELRVTFEDGSAGWCKRFTPSKLGSGFINASVRFDGTTRIKRVVITPRDRIEREEQR